MKKQSQIKRTLTLPEITQQVIDLLNSSKGFKITKIADKICEKFNFLDFRRKLQRTTCMIALRELESEGKIVLPCPGVKTANRSPRRLNMLVPEPKNVPDNVGQIKQLSLTLVKTEEQMRTWNEIMIQDHPRGAKIFVGRQIRYLAGSEHGLLGGFGFSSAALTLEDRDKWIGWSSEEKRSHLHQVVNMNRFLIRSCIKCKNLASRLLGLAVAQFPKDFETEYGYRPLLLESFVDTSQFAGTCYKAANWGKIGKTKGRGRQGQSGQNIETIKDIYVYPLEKDFRDKLGITLKISTDKLDAIEISDGIDGQIWALKEFEGAELGDKRLTQRLIGVATDIAENPGRAYCGIGKGNWPKVKAYYRFIDKPDESKVNMENILLPHRTRTIQRMKGQEIVLCIQDGSDINFNNLDKCEGLGVIGNNQTDVKTKGLHLHSTFAITKEGIPLGVLKAQCSAPKLKSEEDKKKARTLPIEEKKTYSWIEGLNDLQEIKKQIPDTTIINVCDREADIFEEFYEQYKNKAKVELLIRAKHNRSTTTGQKLFEQLIQSEVKAQVTIKVPRQSARGKKSKQKARPKREFRTTEASLRYKKVEIIPPTNHNDKMPLPIWAIHIKEEKAPAQGESIEWFLLTTIELEKDEDAIECIKYYCLRWRIEDWHRVLKSGCKIEKMAYTTAERLKRGIAINMVIAWRIMLMTLLGRKSPELSAEVLFTDLEIKVIKAYAQKKN